MKPGDLILIRFGNSELSVVVKATPEHVPKDMAPSMYEIVDQVSHGSASTME